VEAVTRIKSWLPKASLVNIPDILHFDPHNNVIIMEDCGSGCVTLENILLSGKPFPSDLAKTIGTHIGEFIASMHQWSRHNSDGVLDLFRSNIEGRKTNAFKTYGHVMSVLRPTDGEELPVLLDPPLEFDELEVQTVSTITEQFKKQMIAGTSQDVVSITIHMASTQLTPSSSSWVISGRVTYC
jgi:hypothetical protein